jgi:hypothetical protein
VSLGRGRESENTLTMRLRMKEFDEYLGSKVEIPLVRHGNRQRIETLINE